MLFSRLFVAGAVALAGVCAANNHDDHEGHEDHEDHDHSGGQPSDEEIEKQTREDFGSMDTDGDGLITREEIVKYLDDPNMESEIDDFFGKADENADGSVDYDEYKKFVLNLLAQYEAGGFDQNEHYDMSGEDMGDFDDGDFDFDDEEL